jgi:limonene-1,2-epoxide hydrolase
VIAPRLPLEAATVLVAAWIVLPDHTNKGARVMAINCEKVVSDLFAAWARLDLDGIMSYFTEDAVWDNVPMTPAKGRNAISEMTQGFLKDTSRFNAKINRTVHEGNVVFNERVDTIIMKNGKKADIPVAGMFELNDAGKIKVWRDYFDLGTFTKQTS